MLSYITASKNGLSGMELEDILSLDDVVLGDVFQHWVPPILRIPPLLVCRIRDELSNYLVEREANGTPVIYWFVLTVVHCTYFSFNIYLLIFKSFCPIRILILIFLCSNYCQVSQSVLKSGYRKVSIGLDILTLRAQFDGALLPGYVECWQEKTT